MEKAQARYKRAFDKRLQAGREALRSGDWVLVMSHENQVGKLVFKTLGPYQNSRTDGRRLAIESDDGIRTINLNHATRAREPPEGDPAWARALSAWQVPFLPPSASKPIEAVFDHFVGHGYDGHERLMHKVRWSGYGPREDSWHYVEDLPAEKFANTACDTDSRCDEGYQSTNPQYRVPLKHPCGGRGVQRPEGARPLNCGQHTPGGTPKISRSGPARE